MGNSIALLNDGRNADEAFLDFESPTPTLHGKQLYFYATLQSILAVLLNVIGNSGDVIFCSSTDVWVSVVRMWFRCQANFK